MSSHQISNSTYVSLVTPDNEKLNTDFTHPNFNLYMKVINSREKSNEMFVLLFNTHHSDVPH